jgi:hypothetical protein
MEITVQSHAPAASLPGNTRRCSLNWMLGGTVLENSKISMRTRDRTGCSTVAVPTEPPPTPPLSHRVYDRQVGTEHY